MSYNGESPTLLGYEKEFSPGSGFIVVERWAGTEADLEALRVERAALGQNARLVNTGGETELQIRNPDPTGGAVEESIFDEWSIQTQFEEIPVFADENLLAYLIANNIPDKTLPISVEDARDSLSEYAATIQEHLKSFYDADHKKVANTEGPTPIENFVPLKRDKLTPFDKAEEVDFIKTLYAQVSFGMDKSRTARIVLTRRRTLKTSSASRYQVNSGQLAWTTASLVSVFGVPAGIQALLPAAPGASRTPAGFTWGWALQVQNAQTQGNGARSVETLEWVFAPVRQLTFTIA